MKRKGNLLTWKELRTIGTTVADGSAGVFRCRNEAGRLYCDGEYYYDYFAMRRMYRNLSLRVVRAVAEKQNDKNRN